MITGDYDMLKELAERSQCPEHKRKLDTYWVSEQKTYALYCSAKHFPDEIEDMPTLSSEVRQGGELPEPVQSKVKAGMERRGQIAPADQNGPRLPARYRVDLDTGEVLSTLQVKALIAHAERANLKPELGHVCLMHGQPYVTIDGYLYHARRQDTPYGLTSRPLYPEERDAYLLGEGDIAFISAVTLFNPERMFTAVGVVKKSELEAEARGKPGVKRYPVVADKPWNMAQKRADWQALRRAFPLGGEQ